MLLHSYTRFSTSSSCPHGLIPPPPGGALLLHPPTPFLPIHLPSSIFQRPNSPPSLIRQITVCHIPPFGAASMAQVLRGQRNTFFPGSPPVEVVPNTAV